MNTSLCARCLVLPLLLGGLLSGCSLLDAGEPALRLETDRERYDLGTSETIVVEVRNTSSSVIHFNACMPASLVVFEGYRIRATLGLPVCLCLCRTALAPGERWHYRVAMTWIAQHRDRLALGEDRTYRLRLAFFEDPEMRKRLDEETLYTNGFRLSE